MIDSSQLSNPPFSSAPATLSAPPFDPWQGKPPKFLYFWWTWHPMHPGWTRYPVSCASEEEAQDYRVRSMARLTEFHLKLVREGDGCFLEIADVPCAEPAVWERIARLDAAQGKAWPGAATAAVAQRYAYSRDGETYHGSFGTEQEALEEAFRGNDLATVLVGMCEPPFPAERYLDAAFVLDHVACQDEYAGEWAENWPDASEAQMVELTADLHRAVGGWLDRHGLRPAFYTVRKPREVSRPENTPHP